MKRTAALALGLGALALSWVVYAQVPMRAGRWETTMEMNMPNAPVAIPPMTQAACITEEQLKNPESAIPTGPPAPGGQAPDCKISDFKIDGNRITWRMACAEAQMTGEGDMTVKGDTYDGSVRMKMPLGEMTMKMTGKRIGDC